MAKTTNSSGTKFFIDGDIQSPEDSVYLKNKAEKSLKRYRIFSIILSIALVLSLISGFYLWTLTKNTNSNQTNSNNLAFQSHLDSAKNLIDSLEYVNSKLQLQNDILIENTEPLTGIFFEVHMAYDGDFQLELYKKELSKLLSSDYDGRDQLILGRFRSYKQALLYENDLKKMGLKNLTLLGRVDGTIMTFKDALALVKNQNK